MKFPNWLRLLRKPEWNWSDDPIMWKWKDMHTLAVTFRQTRVPQEAIALFTVDDNGIWSTNTDHRLLPADFLEHFCDRLNRGEIPAWF